MSNTALLEVGEEIRESKSAVAGSERPFAAGAASSSFPVFIDCLLEPAGWQRRQRRWTATLSLITQVLALGISMLIPLMFTDVLPTQQLVTFLVAPPPPPPPPPPVVQAAAVKPRVTEIVSGRLVAPTKIPDKIRMIKEDSAPPTSALGVPGGVAGGVAGGQLGGVLGGIINDSSIRSVVAAPVPVPAKRVRISEGVSAGRLIDRVEPEYPRIAKSARIQGAVELSAWITKEGTIERLTVVRGHPLLAKAAVDAVKRWHYKPFLLNGVPVEVETTVNVIFSLSQSGD
jgi:protein TonB